MTTRPPEPLKDRLATIVQRGHVSKLTSDEVAELILREIGAVSLSNEQIEKLEAQPGCFMVIQYDSCATKDARIAELEKALAPFATYASGAMSVQFVRRRYSPSLGALESRHFRRNEGV